MRVHFIGIAGAGMSATALLMKEAGWNVSGSDAEAYGPPRDTLVKAGIPFTIGYRSENIPADADWFVLGRNAKLSPQENIEVQAALESGKPHYSFPEILGKLTEGRRNLVVAGSYGKSTTTSLVAHMLQHAGVDAGYFIGAEPVPTTWLPSPAHLGSASPFILEGDEYPSAHDDPRPKFMHLHPHDVLLTSVVHDHVNVYPTFSQYAKAFHDLLTLVPRDALVLACADEPGAERIARESGKRVVTYGVESGTYRAKDIYLAARSTFVLMKGTESLGTVETTLLGQHNIENIVAAIAYVLEVGLMSAAQAIHAVSDFPGVRRRLDNIAPHSRVPVLEGFGSSYEKAYSAIAAVRTHFPAKRLVIVFEPHTFGWRNRANMHWYDHVFTEAAVVFITPPETQGAATHEQLSYEEIVDRVGTRGRAYQTPEGVVEALDREDVVLILTSGNLAGTLSTLAQKITERFRV